MARIARVVIPSIPHHLVQRGNRRMKTFFNDDDYRAYIDLTADACSRHEVDIWAYCLMPNHVHLIAVPKQPDSLRRAIGEAHRRYTRRVNLREDWRGHLWQERFASHPLSEHHLLAAARYIEMNPVRAGLTRDPWSYQWSSATPHARGSDDQLVRVSPLLEMVGDWRVFIGEDISAAEIEQFRQHERTGRPMGNPAFIEAVEKSSCRVLHPRKRGPKRH
jgi:putative transposase